MTEIIKLETLELELAREFLVDENNIKKLEAQIDELKNNVYVKLSPELENDEHYKLIKAKALNTLKNCHFIKWYIYPNKYSDMGGRRKRK